MGSTFHGDRGSVWMRNVPALVRNNFKAACARRNKSMKEVLLQFMVEYAKDDGKLKPAKKSFGQMSGNDRIPRPVGRKTRAI